MIKNINKKTYSLKKKVLKDEKINAQKMSSYERKLVKQINTIKIYNILLNLYDCNSSGHIPLIEIHFNVFFQSF